MAGSLSQTGSLNCYATSGESWRRASRSCSSTATTATRSTKASTASYSAWAAFPRSVRNCYFGKKLPKYPDEYPIWSRCITHDFENQGFRLPYHEYLRAGHDPTNIICLVPDGAMLNFSYVAEHVSDDLAVGALERLVQSVQTVKDEGKVPGDWDRHLVWLNDVLSEVWQNRGPFPGIGSVLQYLGFASGTAFHRQVLVPALKKGENAWEYVQAVLEGRRKCEHKRYAEALKQAGERWRAYKERRRRLLSLLVRFELSPQQVERVANPDKRENCGIVAKDADMLANPYLISEMDQGSSESDLLPWKPSTAGCGPKGMRPVSSTRMKLWPKTTPPSAWRGRCSPSGGGAARRYTASLRRDVDSHHQAIPGSPHLPSRS